MSWPYVLHIFTCSLKAKLFACSTSFHSLHILSHSPMSEQSWRRSAESIIKAWPAPQHEQLPYTKCCERFE